MTNKIFQGSVISQLSLQICTNKVLILRYMICSVASYIFPTTEDTSEHIKEIGWMKTGRSVVKSREDRNAR